MAKFYGTIGYSTTTETSPGIWETTIIEKTCLGDLVNNNWRNSSATEINDSVTISNELSIVADPYATEHFFDIRYVKFTMPNLGGGKPWKVSNVKVNYPRLTLTLGGLYNGEQA